MSRRDPVDRRRCGLSAIGKNKWATLIKVGQKLASRYCIKIDIREQVGSCGRDSYVSSGGMCD